MSYVDVERRGDRPEYLLCSLCILLCSGLYVPYDVLLSLQVAVNAPTTYQYHYYYILLLTSTTTYYTVTHERAKQREGLYKQLYKQFT
jgi:hypothetical protein